MFNDVLWGGGILKKGGKKGLKKLNLLSYGIHNDIGILVQTPKHIYAVVKVECKDGPEHPSQKKLVEVERTTSGKCRNKMG